MTRHRFMAEFENVRLPQPPCPAPSPRAFVWCPVSVAGMHPLMAHWQQCLFQWAFEQAVECARPSLPERDLLGVWN
jgi:hypothetical protein